AVSHTVSRSGFRLICGTTMLALIAGCDYFDEAIPHDVRLITITMIAKSESNPVFLSARVGAEAAAKDLSDKYKKIDVAIDWRTPSVEDHTFQADNIMAAVDAGTDAILVSGSNKNSIRTAIDQAVDRGVPVMTFDSDSPDSKRFAFYGADDIALGEQLMKELAKLMGNKGRIAILAGSRDSRNLQQRVAGVKQAASKFPNIEVIGVFNHDESAQAAAAEVLRVNTEHPDIDGWAMIGGWALFNETLLEKLDPEKLKIVAVDALPAQLPYVEKGVVPVLLAQPTFRWGKVSVEKIIDKIHHQKEVPVINTMKLIRVSKENLGGWARQIKAWGYEGIPEYYLTYVAKD
ncbi:MAG: substrate-binding domain-containing protein, partial [Gammaproteobacteria bacterium]